MNKFEMFYDWSMDNAFVIGLLLIGFILMSFAFSIGYLFVFFIALLLTFVWASKAVKENNKFYYINVGLYAIIVALQFVNIFMYLSKVIS